MFARFDENPAMNLQDIKETKRYGRTDGQTDTQRENSIPPTNKVCGGYNYFIFVENLKMGGREGVRANPLWNRHWMEVKVFRGKMETLQ